MKEHTHRNACGTGCKVAGDMLPIPLNALLLKTQKSIHTSTT